MTVEGDRSIIAEPRLAAAMTPRSWVGFAIKLLLTVAILGLLVRRADWHAVLQRASGAHRPLLLAAVAVIMVAIFLAVARWPSPAQRRREHRRGSGRGSHRRARVDRREPAGPSKPVGA